MQQALASVVIPVYNAGKHLRASLDSILNQSYPHLEIFVIDDGSTDGCLDEIAGVVDPRVVVLHQKNSGKSAALNRALDILSGEFYAIQDADDISHPVRIQRQVQVMQEHPEVAAIFTGYDLVLDDLKCAPRFASKDIDACRHDIEHMRMPSHDPTAMYRVNKVRDLRYEPELRVGQGLDYILRVGESHPMLVLGECLYSYRVHLQSNTRRDSIRRLEGVQRVLERAVNRRASFAEPEVLSARIGRNRRDSGAEHGLVTHFMESVLDLRRAGAWAHALLTACQCLRLHPGIPRYYKPLVYALVPLPVVAWYRMKVKRVGRCH